VVETAAVSRTLPPSNKGIQRTAKAIRYERVRRPPLMPNRLATALAFSGGGRSWRTDRG
jgi:hypothetical protein